MEIKIHHVFYYKKACKNFPSDSPFHLQLPFVADKTDAVDSLHGGRQGRQHVGVRGQFRQAEDRQGREAAAQRALDGAGLCRLDIDACQTLQTEGVLAVEHLRAAEDVVELAEADGALQVQAGFIKALRLKWRWTEVQGGEADRDLVGKGGRGRVGVLCGRGHC